MPAQPESEDFLIHVAVRDNQDLYAFVIDRLTERPEIVYASRDLVTACHRYGAGTKSKDEPAGTGGSRLMLAW
jgi:hypothetical protein